jgi:hypothetical protein
MFFFCHRPSFKISNEILTFGLADIFDATCVVDVNQQCVWRQHSTRSTSSRQVQRRRVWVSNRFSTKQSFSFFFLSFLMLNACDAQNVHKLYQHRVSGAMPFDGKLSVSAA